LLRTKTIWGGKRFVPKFVLSRLRAKRAVCEASRGQRLLVGGLFNALISWQAAAPRYGDYHSVERGCGRHEGDLGRIAGATSDISAGASQLAHVALRRTLAPEQNGFLCV
jgi:hypothetical protein